MSPRAESRERRFVVEGASGLNARGIRIVIDALDEGDAASRANDLGLLVSRVFPEEPLATTSVQAEIRRTGVPECLLCGMRQFSLQTYFVLGLPMGVIGITVAAVSALTFLYIAFSFILLLHVSKWDVRMALISAPALGVIGAIAFFYFAVGTVLALTRTVLRCSACQACYPARK